MHKFLLKSFLLGLILTHSIVSQAQPWVTRIDGDHINGRILLEDSQQSTAIVIKSDQYLGDSISVGFAGNHLWVPMDPDGPSYTYFLSYGIKNFNEIELEFENAEIYLINSGDSPPVNASSRTDLQEDCVAPINTIPQSEWRSGLPEPNYTRISTSVKHVVVHHSAGSNTNPNYTQVVRDIYLYHTQTNGWSDIGYNYLVAQNGSIYNGRDPGGIAQDEVLGAHFCGSNSSTMGICLLGNYESAELGSSNYSSLLDIITWKLDHEDLTPFSSNQHALGNFDAIIGHQDGCSTLCPGVNVYQRLSEIKQDVMNRLNCDEPGTLTLDFDASIQVTKTRSVINYLNLSSGYDSYLWHFESGIPETATWTDAGQVNYNYPGLFEVMLIGKAEGVMDTLVMDNFIEIQGDPAVFPNPGASLGDLWIQYHKEIIEAELFGLSGQEFPLRVDENGRYQLPYLLPGLYMLHLQTATGAFGKKILIQ